MAHNLTLLGIEYCRNYFINCLESLREEFNISHHESENVYDWCVRQALSNVLIYSFGARLKEHYRDDLAINAYGRIGYDFEFFMREKIKLNNMRFNERLPVKALVSGDLLVITQGYL